VRAAELLHRNLVDRRDSRFRNVNSLGYSSTPNSLVPDEIPLVSKDRGTSGATDCGSQPCAPPSNLVHHTINVEGDGTMARGAKIKKAARAKGKTKISAAKKRPKKTAIRAKKRAIARKQARPKPKVKLKAKRTPARGKKKAAPPKAGMRPATAAPQPVSPPVSKPQPAGPVAAEALEGPRSPPGNTSGPAEPVANEAPTVIGTGEVPQSQPNRAEPT
jgi:hypothetical protein